MPQTPFPFEPTFVNRTGLVRTRLRWSSRDRRWPRRLPATGDQGMVEESLAVSAWSVMGSSLDAIKAACTALTALVSGRVGHGASGANRNRTGAGAFLGGAGDCAVDAEGLPKPEDSQQHHEHQGQDGGGFGNLGAARFGG